MGALLTDKHAAGDPADSDDDPCMLNRIVRIVQSCTHDPGTGTLTMSEQLLNPVRTDDLHIIVQTYQIIALCIRHAEVVDRRVIKFSVPIYNMNAVSSINFFIIIKDFHRFAVILHDDDLKIPVGALFLNRLNALF